MDNLEEKKILRPIHPKLKLDKHVKKKMRFNLGKNIRVNNVYHPMMIIKISDLLEIVREQSLNIEKDNLLFYLASYRDKEDVERYRLKEDLGSDADDILFKPTLLVTGGKVPLAEPIFYDVAIVKPPPEDSSTQD